MASGRLITEIFTLKDGFHAKFQIGKFTSACLYCTLKFNASIFMG